MHITPIRKDLHWLPIQERINYNIIVTVYKCIHRLAPNYISSILTTRTRDNRLRQKQVCHELNTHSCAIVVGKQAFGTRAPELWNKLPLNIRTVRTLQSFKQTLKTHIYKRRKSNQGWLNIGPRLGHRPNVEPTSFQIAWHWTLLLIREWMLSYYRGNETQNKLQHTGLM